MDLSDLIDRNAAFMPEKAALRFGDASWSYAAFAERIVTAARALKSELGVGRGDRIAVLSLNRPEHLVLLYACSRLGAMLVPLNWRLAVPEQLYILEDASVKALFLEEAFSAVIGPARQALPEIRVIGLDFAPADGAGLAELLEAGRGDGRNPHIDFACPLLIVYTSGTTGRPKGAVLRQEALHWNAVNSVHMHELTAQDHILTVLPLFHVGGLNIQTTPALQFGATVTLHPRFDPAATLGAIVRERPTLTVLVPATIQALIGLPGWPAADVSSLRAVTTGSTIVPQALIDAVTARGVPVLQVYGSTETSPICIYTRNGASPVNSTGLPGLVSEARIVDDRGRELPPGAAGEIVIRGPTVLFEYWGDEAATAEALRNGWYHSGDIGSRDTAGFFYVHERKRNVIVSGGENVYPAEIERVLAEHPDVLDAAVIGRPHPKWQEVPVAFVVRRSDTLSAEALFVHLRVHLARFKLPHEIRFVPELPRNALGKVQHFRLREALAAGAG